MPSACVRAEHCLPSESSPRGLTLWEKHLLPTSSASGEPFGVSKAKLVTATPFISFMPQAAPQLHTFEQRLEDGHIHILLTIFALSENGQELPAPHYVLDLQGKPRAGNQQQHLLLCGAAPGSPWVTCSLLCCPQPSWGWCHTALGVHQNKRSQWEPCCPQELLGSPHAQGEELSACKRLTFLVHSTTRPSVNCS